MNSNNWCPSCEEVCHGHSRICTTCGTTLQQRITSSASNGSNIRQGGQERQNTENGEDRRFNAGTWPAALANVGSTTAGTPDAVMLRGLNPEELSFFLEQAANETNGNTGGTGAGINAELWQAIPPELLDPTGGGASAGSSRPTSEKVLKQLLRIKLTADSSFLYSSVLTIKVPVSRESNKNENNDNNTATASTTTASPSRNTDRTIEMEAITAEFGLSKQQQQQKNLIIANARLIIPDHPPRTGKGGKLSICLSPKTATVPETQDEQKDNVIVYLERGDGITFVQKALLAQKAVDDANNTNTKSKRKIVLKAVVIGNNMSSPWPYIMKDSSNEAETMGLKQIPVVMISERDAQTLIRLVATASTPTSTTATEGQSSVYSNLQITNSQHNSNNKRECIICTDTFAIGHTILKLPLPSYCGHAFHESCALMWLKKHNTCPMCRYELPTDDAEYEDERRRRRTHSTAAAVGAASGGRNNSNVEYYG